MLQFSEDGSNQDALDSSNSEPADDQEAAGGGSEPQDDGQSLGEGDQTGDQGGEGGSDQRQALDREPQNRKERRAAWIRERRGKEMERAARERAEQELAELRRQMKELTGGVSEMVKLQRESLPKPPDPRMAKLEQTRKDIVAALGRLNPDNPATFQQWRELEEQLVDIRAEMKAEAVKDELRKEFAESQPRQRPQWQQALFAEHPWIAEDEANEELVAVTAKQIARLKRRDLNNPAVLQATVREAAAQVAAQYGLGKAKADPTARDRVAGASGKGGAAGQSNSGMPTPNQAMISAALTMFPHAGSVEASLKQWWNAVGQDVMANLKK